MLRHAGRDLRELRPADFEIPARLLAEAASHELDAGRSTAVQ
jgi:hypothetical protein